LIVAAQAALERKETVRIERDVRNVNRTVGAMLSGEVAKRYGHEGLPNNTIQLAFNGVAGQSFGAFLAHGITAELVGDANDYVGKGLSGGRVIVKQPSHVKRDPTDNIIVGNTVLYGAIAGEAYFNGVAGERFAVRNSGAVAVVEGTGDHGCEYMTGGVVAVLGKTGRNFAAGMSGGVAYVYDEDGLFRQRCNMAMVAVEAIEPDDDTEKSTGEPQQRTVDVHDFGMGDMLYHSEARLRILLERHHLYTGSKRARALLDDWENALGKFVKVMPLDYKRALKQLEAERLDTIVAAE
jgi:glutamate synthase (NADPH) large chain